MLRWSGACLLSSLLCLCTPRLAGRSSWQGVEQASTGFSLSMGPSPSFPYSQTPLLSHSLFLSLPTLNHRFTPFHATWGSHCARFHGHWEAPCVMCFKVSRPWAELPPAFNGRPNDHYQTSQLRPLFKERRKKSWGLQMREMAGQTMKKCTRQLQESESNW